MSDLDYIRERVPEGELLAQLAEEAMELGHAALKLRRALDGINPTPVSVDEALANIQEEIADVDLLLVVLQYDPPTSLTKRVMFMDAKLQRWASRLREKERTEAG